MSMLEDRLNVVLARLRVIEEALHGQHDWAFRFTGLNSDAGAVARVQIFDDRVQFVALVPAPVSFAVVELWMDNEMIHAVTDPHHIRHAHMYVWEWRIESPLSVA